MMENISDNELQPFWYDIRLEDGSSGGNFIYIVQNGETLCSTIVLVFENGQWEEPYVGPEYFTYSPPEVSKFGENGCQVVITTNRMAGGSDVMILVFETDVDFTKPLPIDKFSPKDSIFRPFLGEEKAIQSITPGTPPTAVTDTEKPADKN